MSFGKSHEIHTRRFGRNLGVGLVLAALIAVMFGLTMVKVSNDFGGQGGAAAMQEAEQ